MAIAEIVGITLAVIGGLLLLLFCFSWWYRRCYRTRQYAKLQSSQATQNVTNIHSARGCGNGRPYPPPSSCCGSNRPPPPPPSSCCGSNRTPQQRVPYRNPYTMDNPPPYSHSTTPYLPGTTPYAHDAIPYPPGMAPYLPGAAPYPAAMPEAPADHQRLIPPYPVSAPPSAPPLPNYTTPTQFPRGYPD